MNQAQKMMLLYSSVGRVPGSPDQPTALAAVYDTTNTEIDVTWTAPTDVGDSAIIDYQVQYRQDGGSWTVLEMNSTDTASTLDSPMSMGTTYTFRVLARNTQGVGAWSSPVSVTIGTAPVDPVDPVDGTVRGDARWNDKSALWGDKYAKWSN